MKREAYMSRDEMIDYLKIGVLASECKAIAERTPDKDWHKRLTSAVTLLAKVVDERAACLDREQLLSVARRHKNTKVMLQTVDQIRYGELEKEIIQADLADLETLAELALEYCKGCELAGQGKTDCRYRVTMHRLGIEINPGWEGCEFR